MAKGSSFERSLCYALSEWWLGKAQDDEDFDCCFWRTAGSGARATSRTKAGKRTNRAHVGDIASTDPISAPFSKLIAVEAKAGYTWDGSLHNCLDKTKTAAKTKYEEWIHQAATSAANSSAPYWLILHWRSRHVTLATYPHAMAMSLGRLRHIVSPHAEITLHGGQTRIHSTTFDNLLEALSPDEVRRAVTEMEDAQERV